MSEHPPNPLPRERLLAGLGVVEAWDDVEHHLAARIPDHFHYCREISPWFGILSATLYGSGPATVSSSRASYRPSTCFAEEAGDIVCAGNDWRLQPSKAETVKSSIRWHLFIDWIFGTAKILFLRKQIPPQRSLQPLRRLVVEQ